MLNNHLTIGREMYIVKPTFANAFFFRKYE